MSPNSSVPSVEVVWSGPEGPAPEHRTTSAVVQDLFRRFQDRLLISTYNIDVGARADDLFGALADRMDRTPTLHVDLFVNIPARDGEPTAAAVASFRQRFVERVWPGHRLPNVWYDPRALLDPALRAVLHAKCVVADRAEAFVTSANFTEAAHARNVELGLFVRDATLARAIARPFEALVETGRVGRL